MGGIMMEEIFCQGCGVQIQTTDKQEPGYTPKSSLNREDILCQRCFRLKHYNEIQDVNITDDDFLKMVSNIREKEGLIVHIVDLFDVSGSLIRGLPRITGDNPIILVGNKIDLLPKSINHHQLENWLRAMAKEAGLKVKDAVLISSVKGYGLEELSKTIESHRDDKDVYIVGTTNVGKSTFINRLIDESVGEKNIITTSYFPGTTLGFIEIPLDNTSSMIDTPGIVNNEQIAHHISKEDLKVITPTKEIKPRGYQLNEGQTLFFGGLARLDIIKGNKQSIICYFSNELSIHRTKTDKADELYANHLGDLLSPPSKKSMKSLPKMTSSTFKMADGKTDIVFPGLGWVSVSGEDITIRAHSLKDVSISIRKSLL